MRSLLNQNFEGCSICRKENGCKCPNCGGAEIQREFHSGDLTTEVFCARCGFVIFS